MGVRRAGYRDGVFSQCVTWRCWWQLWLQFSRPSVSFSRQWKKSFPDQTPPLETPAQRVAEQWRQSGVHRRLCVLGRLVVEFTSTLAWQSCNELTEKCAKSLKLRWGVTKLLPSAGDLQPCPVGCVESRAWWFYCEIWWTMSSSEMLKAICSSLPCKCLTVWVYSCTWTNPPLAPITCSHVYIDI